MIPNNQLFKSYKNLHRLSNDTKQLNVQIIPKPSQVLNDTKQSIVQIIPKPSQALNDTKQSIVQIIPKPLQASNDFKQKLVIFGNIKPYISLQSRQTYRLCTLYSNRTSTLVWTVIASRSDIIV